MKNTNRLTERTADGSFGKDLSPLLGALNAKKKPRPDLLQKQVSVMAPLVEVMEVQKILMSMCRHSLVSELCIWEEDALIGQGILRTQPAAKIVSFLAVRASRGADVKCPR